MSPPPAKKTKPNSNNFSRKKIIVQTGQRGFLATCNYQEKGCVRECFNILAHYANFVYGAECIIPPVDEIKDMEKLQAADISDDLQREINFVQQQSYKPKQARFLALDTGVINTVFIRTTLLDPVQLACFIVRDIFNTKFKRTRSLIRLIPIEVVCNATNIQTIIKAVSSTIEKYFTKKPCSYSIVVNRRLNNSVDRDTIIRELASLVRAKNQNNKVDLKNPEKTIVVEIIKGTCMIGVLPSYFKYKKYNLIECARSVNEVEVDIEAPISTIIEESPQSPTEGDAAAEEDNGDGPCYVEDDAIEGPIDDEEQSTTVNKSFATVSSEKSIDGDDDDDEIMKEEELAEEVNESEPQKALTDSPDSPEEEPVKKPNIEDETAVPKAIEIVEEAKVSESEVAEVETDKAAEPQSEILEKSVTSSENEKPEATLAANIEADDDEIKE